MVAFGPPLCGGEGKPCTQLPWLVRWWEFIIQEKPEAPVHQGHDLWAPQMACVCLCWPELSRECLGSWAAARKKAEGTQWGEPPRPWHVSLWRSL